ncbi:MAG: hypothetical protein LBU21_03185 [Treponema sp.]|nr:hypothetical protein [Treponema sp.]
METTPRTATVSSPEAGTGPGAGAGTGLGPEGADFSPGLGNSRPGKMVFRSCSSICLAKAGFCSR